MYYYVIDFNATDELLTDGWCAAETFDGSEIIEQQFYVKSSTKIETKEQMRHFLLVNCCSTENRCDNLINCVNTSTANEIYAFYEIDDEEFEMSCGIPA